MSLKQKNLKTRSQTCSQKSVIPQINIETTSSRPEKNITLGNINNIDLNMDEFLNKETESDTNYLIYCIDVIIECFDNLEKLNKLGG
jgi:hypothetical protein